MIKYTICTEQPGHIRDRYLDDCCGAKKRVEDEVELANIFEELEKRGLEERLYIPEPRQRIFLFSYDDEMFCIFFRCTGVNTGHFTFRTEMHGSGAYIHSDSLEFTFE